jgi:2-dehydro-3-deoxy-L-rhamnonate dehydrogenase (NAD+)
MARTALVTGGASGIGRACAERLAADGLNVVTADLADGADVRLDVTDAARVAEVVAGLDRVDVLVNSAGVIGPNKPLAEVTDAEWAATFAVNTTGTFHLCRAVTPGMVERGWGRVVNLASIAGKDGNPGLTVYSATKAAVIGLTKALGKELATTGVLVNAVAPALIESPMNADTEPATLARLASLIPMGRLGQPTEVAELVAWLASDRCTFSTGAVYDITGGRATY